MAMDGRPPPIIRPSHCDSNHFLQLNRVHICSEMIYDPTQQKFRSHLRRLTKAERVYLTYVREMQNAEFDQEKKLKREERRWYPNWDTAKPALYMDMVENRKNIEFENWKKRMANLNE